MESFEGAVEQDGLFKQKLCVFVQSWISDFSPSYTFGSKTGVAFRENVKDVS